MSSSIVVDSQSPPADSARGPRPSHPRSLGDAVAAVTEHCLQTELRRLNAAQARTNSGLTAEPARLVTSRGRLHQLAMLERLLEHGPLILLGFDAAAPHRVRELSTASLGKPADARATLLQWFTAADAQRVRHALLAPDGDVTLAVELTSEVGTTGRRYLMSVLAPDPLQPDLRWAWLVRLSQPTAERTSRRPLPKPALGPRAPTWPSLQSR